MDSIFNRRVFYFFWWGGLDLVCFFLRTSVSRRNSMDDCDGKIDSLQIYLTLEMKGLQF